MLKKHKRHKPGKWLAGSAAFVMTLSLVGPFATPVFAAGGDGSSTTVQTSYPNFSAVSNVKINNVSLKKYGRYSLSFNANGGSGTMPSYGSQLLDDPVTLTNQYLKTGYLFNGWSTKADGSGLDFKDKQSVTADDLGAKSESKIVLYAQWKPITYKVHFTAGNPQGSTVSGSMADQTLTYDQTDLLSNNTFTVPGYQLTGWKDGNGRIRDNMAAVRNLSARDGDTINMTGQWTPIDDAKGINVESDVQHTHIWQWKYDGTKHWEQCSICGKIKEGSTSAHHMTAEWSAGSNTCSESNYYVHRCTDCGYGYREHPSFQKKHPHIYYGQDAMGHVAQCTDCGEILIEGSSLNSDTVLQELAQNDDTDKYLTEYGKQHHIYQFYHHQNGKIIGQNGSTYVPGKCDTCGRAFDQWFTRMGTNIRIYNNNWRTADTTHEFYESTDTAFINVDKSNFKIYQSGENKVTFEASIQLTNKTMQSVSTYWDFYATDEDPDHPDTAFQTVPKSAFSVSDKTSTYNPSTRVVSAKCTYNYNSRDAYKYGIRGLFLRIFTVDTNGVRYLHRFDFMSFQEKTPPVINDFSTTKTSGSNGWYNGFTFNMSGTESLSSDVSLSITDKSGNQVWAGTAAVDPNTNLWSAAVSNVHLTADANGESFTLTVTDQEGNAQTKQTTVTNIDTAPPVLTNPINVSGWHKTVNWTANAIDTGVGGVQIGVNTEADLEKKSAVKQNGTTYTRSYHFTGDKYDDSTWYAFVKDALGNVRSYPIKVGMIDNTAPHINSVAVNGLNVTVTADDINATLGKSGSGVVKYGYIDASSDDTSIHTSTTGKTFTLPHSGRYLILAYDAVGNMSEAYPVEVRGTQAAKAKSAITFFDTSE